MAFTQLGLANASVQGAPDSSCLNSQKNADARGQISLALQLQADLPPAGQLKLINKEFLDLHHMTSATK